MNKNSKTRSIILTAVFAALTFVGTSIRIPMPAVIGAPFIHLGNSILVLAVLLIGYKYGALAGGIGFALFDVLNGYALEAPYFFIESFIVGGAAILVFRIFHYKDDAIYKIVLVAIGAAITKIIMTFLKGTFLLIIMGSSFNIAVSSSLLSLLPTIINACSTIIIVSILYYPLKKILVDLRSNP